jgi:hypothetical protein
MSNDQDFSFECLICGKTIEDNQRMLSLEGCIEHERDGAYDVDSAEGYLTTCESCYTEHDIQNRIQEETDTLIESAKNKHQSSKAQKISAINNRYNCSVCAQPIPNSFQIFTTSYPCYTTIGPSNKLIIQYSSGILKSDDRNLHFQSQNILPEKLDNFRISGIKEEIAIRFIS